MASKSTIHTSDSKRIQLVITPECGDDTPTSTTDSLKKGSKDEFPSAHGQKMVRAQIHALVPESICTPSPKVNALQDTNVREYSYRQDEEATSKNEATTQTKETRLVSAAELEAICQGKRAHGFPRESEDQPVNEQPANEKSAYGQPAYEQPAHEPDSSCCHCKQSKQKSKSQKSKSCCRSKSKPRKPCPYCACCQSPSKKSGSCCRSKSRSPHQREKSPACCKCGQKKQQEEKQCCKCGQEKEKQQEEKPRCKCVPQNQQQEIQQNHESPQQAMCPRCKKCPACQKKCKSKCVIQ